MVDQIVYLDNPAKVTYNVGIFTDTVSESSGFGSTFCGARMFTFTLDDLVTDASDLVSDVGGGVWELQALSPAYTESTTVRVHAELKLAYVDPSIS